MLHVVLFNDEYIVWFSTPNNEIQSEKRSTGIPAQLPRSEQYTQIESSIFEERKISRGLLFLARVVHI